MSELYSAMDLVSRPLDRTHSGLACRRAARRREYGPRPKSVL